MSEVDTIREKYYKPAEISEKIGDIIFWIVSAVSILILFFDKTSYPLVVDAMKIMLIIMTISFFLQGQVNRLYFFPRAEDQRRKDLLSNSFGVTLTHETTVGYYNNDRINSIKSLASSVMENSFFTKEISRKMLTWQRIKIMGYIAVYLIALSIRSTDLELLAVAAQALFGGEIIARLLRMEWLRIRSEQTFDNLNGLFSDRPSFTQPQPQSKAIDLFTFYETTKSTAAVLLSSKVFHQNNTRLSQEWEQIRRRLSI